MMMNGQVLNYKFEINILYYIQNNALCLLKVHIDGEDR